MHPANKNSMTRMLPVLPELERLILNMKLTMETENFKAFLEDFNIEYVKHTCSSSYDKRNDITSYYGKCQVTVTYKPRNVSVMYTYEGHMLNSNDKPTKKTS